MENIQKIENNDFLLNFVIDNYYAFFYTKNTENDRYYISNFGKLKEIIKNVKYQTSGHTSFTNFTDGTSYIFENGKINVTNICFHIKFVIEKICEGEKMQCIHLHDSFLTFESLFTNEH